MKRSSEKSGLFFVYNTLKITLDLEVTLKFMMQIVLIYDRSL